MGVVWRARDTELDREVAIKELRLPDQVEEEERRVRYARVKREARAAARLRHPGVVTVYDRVIGDDGRPWIVMELVQGGSLADLLRRDGRLPVRQVARIGLRMVDALSAAHALGVVHRDIKPANVLLEGDDRVVPTDFGIAALEGDATITRSGMLLGTPAFMSPEQVRGLPATPRSDLWALGATLYAAVEGRPPFTGPTHGSVYIAITAEDPAPAVHAGPLADVLDGLLRKDPEERWTIDRTRDLLTTLARDPDPAPVAPADTEAPAPPSPTATDDLPPPRPPGARSRTGLIAAVFLALAGTIAALTVALWPEKRPVSTVGPIPSPTVTEVSGHGLGVNSIAYSPDGGTLVSTDGRVVRLTDAATGRPIAVLARGEAGKVEVSQVAYSPDGARVAAAVSADVRVWDASTRRLTGTLTGHRDSVMAIAFSRDGRRLVSGGFDGIARVWDLATGRTTATVSTGGTDIGAVAFSPDGETVLTGGGGLINGRLLLSYDSRIRLWDADTGRSAGGLDGRRGKIEGLAFSPDGRTLAASGSGFTIHLWDWQSRRRSR
jgi:sugar lactone lactonase YvrE